MDALERRVGEDVNKDYESDVKHVAATAYAVCTSTSYPRNELIVTLTSNIGKVDLIRLVVCFGVLAADGDVLIDQGGYSNAIPSLDVTPKGST